MFTVHSRDGTEISSRETGQGSPVLLVHDMAADGTHWDPVASLLSVRFRVYVMDRRGRGASGDTMPYAIEREYEDIVAVIESIGAPIAVVGHGYGGLCALEATQRTGLVRKLALYEPATRPVTLNDMYSGEALERFEALVASEQRTEEMVTLLGELLGLTPSEATLMQGQVVWGRRLAAVDTVSREIHAHRQYAFDPSRFAASRVPTLLLVGSESPPAMRMQAEAAAHLPLSRTVELPQQGHGAIDTAPGLLARELVEWLRDTF